MPSRLGPEVVCTMVLTIVDCSLLPNTLVPLQLFHP